MSFDHFFPLPMIGQHPQQRNSPSALNPLRSGPGRPAIIHLSALWRSLSISPPRLSLALGPSKWLFGRAPLPSVPSPFATPPSPRTHSRILRKSLRVKRPPNAFMLYGQSMRAVVRSKFPHLDNSQVSKVLGSMWRQLSDGERQVGQARVTMSVMPDYHLGTA